MEGLLEATLSEDSPASAALTEAAGDSSDEVIKPETRNDEYD
jgi:hypothetical protein